MTAVTTAPPATALGFRSSDAPRVGLNALHGIAEDHAREVGARLLTEYDQRGDGGFGSGGAPDLVLMYEHRPHGVEFHVHDDASIQSQRAWHAYWRANSDPKRGYPCSDKTLAAAAPPEPTHDYAFVVEATWSALRAWLDAPQQVSMFDLLGGDA
jgi:hypothetical protein